LSHSKLFIVQIFKAEKESIDTETETIKIACCRSEEIQNIFGSLL